MNKVYCVEHVSRDSILIHIASTKDKAIKWCQENLAIELGCSWGYFRIYDELIDESYDEDMGMTDVFYIDKDGTVGQEIPKYAHQREYYLQTNGLTQFNHHRAKRFFEAHFPDQVWDDNDLTILDFALMLEGK